MADGYKVTRQTEGDELQPDGTYLPVIEVAFTTTSSPPVSGTVAVPKALASSPANFADAVRIAIESRVAAHGAVAALGGS